MTLTTADGRADFTLGWERFGAKLRGILGEPAAGRDRGRGLHADAPGRARRHGAARSRSTPARPSGPRGRAHAGHAVELAAVGARRAAARRPDGRDRAARRDLLRHRQPRPRRPAGPRPGDGGALAGRRRAGRGRRGRADQGAAVARGRGHARPRRRCIASRAGSTPASAASSRWPSASASRCAPSQVGGLLANLLGTKPAAGADAGHRRAARQPSRTAPSRSGRSRRGCACRRSTDPSATPDPRLPCRLASCPA